jgi:membrane fusion protein, heavy metal efflux system
MENQITTNAARGKRLSKFTLLLMMGVAAVAFVAGLAVRGSRQSPPLPAAQSAPESPEHPPDMVDIPASALANVKFLTERAELRSVSESIQATGTVGPNETRVAHIRPLANGRIEKVLVNIGDRVSAGQPLIEYDNIALGELVGQYVANLAALEKAQADSEVARRALNRARNLVDVGALAQAELDRRDAEYKNSLAAISSQRAEIAKVDEKLHRFGLNDDEIGKLQKSDYQYHREASQSVVKAPFPGVVIKYTVSPGEVVDSTSDLMTIADLSTVWLQADVYEKDIASVRVGQQARITVDSYPGTIFLGRITYISDFLDPKTRTSRVRCEVPNSDGRLKLDMFATIQLPTPSTRTAVMVPTDAIQMFDNQPAVFTPAGQNRYQRRNVRLGSQADGWIEIIAGLGENDLVVTIGSFYLKSAMLRELIGGEE